MPIVNSHTEWDPLEEVIVGRVEGATIPDWHVSGKAVWPEKWWPMFKSDTGKLFPQDLIEGGKQLAGRGVPGTVCTSPQMGTLAGARAPSGPRAAHACAPPTLTPGLQLPPSAAQ